MESQKFCLKWDGFRSSVTSAFDLLRQDEELVDITLCCEGQRVRAHRMMLSACSPYFRELLKNNQCQQMVVFLKDTTAMDLQSIIEFIYKGSVNVSQAQLGSFIKTAEMLQIRGLSCEDDMPNPEKSDARSGGWSGAGDSTPHSKRPRRHSGSPHSSPAAPVPLSAPLPAPVPGPVPRAPVSAPVRAPVPATMIARDSALECSVPSESPRGRPNFGTAHSPPPPPLSTISSSESHLPPPQPSALPTEMIKIEKIDLKEEEVDVGDGDCGTAPMMARDSALECSVFSKSPRGRPNFGTAHSPPPPPLSTISSLESRLPPPSALCTEMLKIEKIDLTEEEVDVGDGDCDDTSLDDPFGDYATDDGELSGEFPEETPELSLAALSQATLTGEILTEETLSEQTLSEATLRDATLGDATLRDETGRGPEYRGLVPRRAQDGEGSMQDSGTFSCPVCGRRYTNPRSLEYHKKSHTGLTTCVLCGKVASEVEHLRRHLENVHKLTQEGIRSIVPTRHRNKGAPGPGGVL